MLRKPGISSSWVSHLALVKTQGFSVRNWRVNICRFFIWCVSVVQVVLHGAEDSKVDLKKVEEILKSDKSITNVAMVHCETSTGVIHPVAEVGKLVKAHAPDASFFVDAMSSFGAVPLNLDLANIDFMVSSANKCIEGVPGFSFVIGHIESLKKCKGWARSLSLDIVDQYEGLNQNGQFRFTPATHAMLAFRRALSEFKAEGGVDGRANRWVALFLEIERLSKWTDYAKIFHNEL